MVPTGIDALDERLGGLVPSRYYIVSGAPGTGKTTAALQFLGAGLEAGERCAILTQDDPDDLLGQADFLGHDFRAAAEDGRLSVLQYRLDFAHNYARVAEPERLADELYGLLEGEAQQRFVIDSAVPFLDSETASGDPAGALAGLLERIGATTWLTLPGDVDQPQYWRIYDRIVTGAGGIFHLDRVDAQVRELSIRKLRQTAVSTEPFRFGIRPGAGIVEQAPAAARHEVPDEARRRVVVLNLERSLPDDLAAGLERAYEVRTFHGVAEAFTELARGHFGALVLAFDPRAPDAAFDLVRQLRELGIGAAVIFVSPAKELRATARARGLRAGGDEFLTDELHPSEFLARVEGARRRGHGASEDGAGVESMILQPLDDAGEPLAIEESELRRAVENQVNGASHPFFALATFKPAPGQLDAAWTALCQQLRVREGDLLAKTDDGRITAYLHDINRRHVKELLARIRKANPRLRLGDDAEVLTYPGDRAEVDAWLADAAAVG
ncbi:MAG TPA: ATPase domain-containing protein [Longimicrobiaceae bacterium]|nr:ATPase domain-containing protein [Longimicrobiaceae bacterium]